MFLEYDFVNYLLYTLVCTFQLPIQPKLQNNINYQPERNYLYNQNSKTIQIVSHKKNLSIFSKIRESNHQTHKTVIFYIFQNLMVVKLILKLNDNDDFM